MFQSVRARLTLWYTGILALVLVTFSGISYVFLSRAIRAATDASLSDTAREFAAAFSAEHPPSDLRLDFRYSDREMSIYAPTGEVIASSRTHMPRGNRREIAAAIRSGMRGFRTFGQFRAYAVPIDVLGHRHTAVVAQSLEEQHQRLAAAARAVILAIPIALLVAAAGGYLLARKSLEPVMRMSAQAREIGAGTLDQRIAVVNELDELGFLATTLNELLARLQRAFESQKRFMADASHEMRTPVSIIQGEADVVLARTDRDPREYQASIEIMRKAALNLTRIVQNLFLLAGSDTGTYPINRSRFYLDEVLADCVRAMRTAALSKRIELTCDFASDLTIVADEELTRRLFLNLIDNAVKFTPEQGSVSARARPESDGYVVRVTDTGPGISDVDRPHIFERFFRGDRTRRRAAGAGLGLSIAKWIAEIHGGQLLLERADPNGTVFAVLLPKAESALSDGSSDPDDRAPGAVHPMAPSLP